MGLLPKLPFFGSKDKEKDDDDIKTTRPFTVSFSRGEPVPVRRKVQAYTLTPLGKQRISEVDAQDAECQILMAVEEYPGSTIQMIADRTHMSQTRIDRLINRHGGLLDGGLLRPASAGGA